MLHSLLVVSREERNTLYREYEGTKGSIFPDSPVATRQIGCVRLMA